MKRLVRVGFVALFAALLVSAAFASGPRFDARLAAEHSVPILHEIAVDGPLTMADNGHQLRLAVWSYRSGLELDIAVSLQIGRTWTPAELLGQGNGLSDYAPDVSFLPDGRPVIVWTQRDLLTNETAVVFALLTASGWTAPERVNVPGTTATAPHLVPSASRLSVVYLDGSGALVTRAFVTGSERRSEDTSGQSGSNGPDPMPNIEVPPERDPSEFPQPREKTMPRR